MATGESLWAATKAQKEAGRNKQINKSEKKKKKSWETRSSFKYLDIPVHSFHIFSSFPPERLLSDTLARGLLFFFPLNTVASIDFFIMEFISHVKIVLLPAIECYFFVFLIKDLTSSPGSDFREGFSGFLRAPISSTAKSSGSPQIMGREVK